MKWTQVKVHCSVKDLDTVCAVMCVIDSGLMIEDYSDIEENLMTVYGELIDEKILKSDRNAAAVSVFIPEEKDLPACVDFIKERFQACNIDCVMEMSDMSEENWAEQWKKYYKPVRVGKRLVVLPPWEHYDFKEDDVAVVMDPGMAFGTGTHETTRLCLSMLEKHLKKGEKVLDVGTGSGILAIAALKLGASFVYAYDIDPVAVRVAKDNLRANKVEDRAVCGQSDLLANVDRLAAPFSFVTANIVADILIRMAPDIGRYMTKGARFVASGIIEARKPDVITAMEAGGLNLIDSGDENGWTVLIFQKDSPTFAVD